MAATCPTDFDITQLRTSVRSVYTRVAEEPHGEFHFHRGAAYAIRLLGYDPGELATIPERATSRFAGVGALPEPELIELAAEAGLHEGQSHDRYARAIAASKRARWSIESDVIRARSFAPSEKLLPDALSLAHELTFLDDGERIFLSQVQGRTYANVFGLVERFINAKVLELGEQHRLGDQTVLEALVRLIELFTQVHYKASIDPDPLLSQLFKDVFRFHWMEESQHAILDELEWVAEDARLAPADRERAVSDLIELVAAVDAILHGQAAADATYFVARAGRAFSAPEQAAIRATFLRAYRHQYILSGVKSTRFVEILRGLIGETELARVEQALHGLRS